MNKFRYISFLGYIAIGFPSLIILTMITVGIYANIKKPTTEEIIVQEVKKEIKQPQHPQKEIEPIKKDTVVITKPQHIVEVKPIIKIEPKDTFINVDTLQLDTMIQTDEDTTKLLYD